MSSKDIQEDLLTRFGSFLDENVFLPLYKSRTGQFQFSLSSLAPLTKVSKKLFNIKVYCSILTIFFALSSIRFFLGGKIQSILYLLIAFDFFSISYNSYDRAYFDIVTKKTLNDPKEMSASVMSLLSNTIGVVTDKSDKLNSIVSEVNWSYLLSGTITETLISMVLSYFFL
jgi:hypothetical protein